MRRLNSYIQRLLTAADHLRYIVRLFWRTAPGPTMLIVVVNFLTGLSAPLIVWSMERIVNALVQGGLASQVTLPLVALFIALLLESMGQAGTDYVAAVVREQMDDKVRSELLHAASSIPLDDYETPSFYKKLDNAYNMVGGSSMLGPLEDLSAFISATTSTVG